MDDNARMNPHELELHYPWHDTLPEPELGLQVAPGVFWVRMELPFALNHINLWLIRDEVDGIAGWTVWIAALTAPRPAPNGRAFSANSCSRCPFCVSS